MTFSGNSADQNGGAIANLRDGGQITLINDTISGNTALGTGGTPGGGAIFNADTNVGNVQASNTIFASSGGAGGNCAYSASGLAGAGRDWQPAVLARHRLRQHDCG